MPMRTRCVRWICLSWIFLSGLLAVSAFAQRPITLEVLVTNKSGKPVPGLQQQDFKLLDNKQPQKILSFEAVSGPASADPPVEVIFIIDEVNTRFTNVSFERAQVEKYLRSSGGELPHPTALAILSDSGLMMGNITTQDGNALATQLDQNRAGLRSITRSQGVYGAGDRIGLSLNAVQQLADLEAPRPGRKLVIWLSPGWPYLSGPNEQLDSKDQRRIFGNIVGLSASLQKARITLYSIDPLGTADSGGFRTTYYEEFVKGVKKADQAQIGDVALQVLATQSGGRVLFSNNDVAGEIASVVADANTYYVLTFDSLAGDGPDEYHALDIKIDKSGLKALTRTGYYAQPQR